MVDFRGMKNYQCIILLTLLQLSLGLHTSTWEGHSVRFHLQEFSLGTINMIEWKYHTINRTILLARITLNKKHSKMFSKRTGMQIMENGTLQIEDIKDEDSGNYSCTIIFNDQRVKTEQIFLQVLNEDLKTEPPNSTLYTATLKPSVQTRVPGTALIAIPVCSALAILLIVAAIFIFKCRKKCCCTSEEPIYANKTPYNSRK